MGMTIVEDAGVKAGTLGKLLHNFKELMSKGACL
jgi:hypothetical protein